jgi:uridine phosphorylase
MSQIAASELILNNRGAIYHLNLKPEELANTIITVGDPDRVSAVSKYFDKIEFESAHREFITHTGFIGKKRLTVVSTGIGTDNIDIVMNELDALVNIDLTTRTTHEKLTTLTIVRIGTSGSLQAGIPVDSFVASTHGLGIDNLMNFYQQTNNSEELEILQAFKLHTRINEQLAAPNISAAGMGIQKHFVGGFHHGITVTCPGFYGPQGRILRLPLTNKELVDQLTSFRYGNHQITNFEMETSAIYGLGRLLGHQCLSLSAIVANRVDKVFSKDGNAVVEALIQKTIGILSSID